MPMAAKFGKMMASLEGLLPIMVLTTSLCSRGLARSPDKLKTHISITTMPVATKLEMMVAYLELRLPM